jgi:uncharacterized repeat protein (TIGR02543 family)
MAIQFQINQRLPVTTKLKIAWAESDLEALLSLRPFITTDNGSYNLIRTIIEIGSQFENYLVTIGTNNLIAGWQQQYAQSPTWYLSCGNLGSSSCGTSLFVIIDTSNWSYTKRTIHSIGSGIADAGFTWEDLSPDPDKFTVSFNSVYGSDISAYENIESGSTIPAPDEPHRELHDFLGWFKDAEYTEAWDFDSDTVEDHITLYAKWELAVEVAGEANLIEAIFMEGETDPLPIENKSVIIPIGTGQDGKEIVLDKTETHIVWKYVGDASWIELVALNALKGDDGLSGTDGSDGSDGIGIQDATIEDSNLVLTLTDGRTLNLGNVVGADGPEGPPGQDGIDGQNAELIRQVISDFSLGGIATSATLATGTTFQEFVELLLTGSIEPPPEPPETVYYPILTSHSAGTIQRISGSATLEVGEAFNHEFSLSFDQGSITGRYIDGTWYPDSTTTRVGDITFSWEGTPNGSSNPNSYIKNTGNVAQGTNTINAVVNFLQGEQPKDSNGDNFSTPSGPGSTSVSTYVVGQRKYFYGSTVGTPDSIRDLTGMFNPIKGTQFIISGYEGTNTITIAYPKSLGAINKIMRDGENDTELFVRTEQNVTGANGLFPIAYYIYTWQLAGTSLFGKRWDGSSFIEPEIEVTI